MAVASMRKLDATTGPFAEARCRFGGSSSLTMPTIGPGEFYRVVPTP
jgi:hypothetical protein